MGVEELAVVCNADQQSAAPAIENICVWVWASCTSVALFNVIETDATISDAE